MNDLIAVFLKSAIALSTEAPDRFQLFPYGQVFIEGREQPAVMDDASAAMVLAHFNEIDHDTVIDYEHQTLTGSTAPAAGWIKAKKLEWRGKDGLWANVEWTKDAAGMIERKEYRYHSPVVLVRKSDNRIIALHSVALTNSPRIKNSAALAAKHNLFDIIHHQTKGEKTMWERLKKLLGLAGDASEDNTVEAVEAMVNKNRELQTAVEKQTTVVACKEVLEALKLDADADAETVVAAISGLGATDEVAQQLSIQVATLTKEIAEMKQGGLVAEALKNGQTSPEELDKWGRELALKNPKQFRLIVLSRPKGSVIPIDDLGRPPKDDETIADDAQLEINKMMGVDAETWKKYSPKADA